MSSFDFFDPFTLFCVFEALAVFALLVVGFGLSVNCAHVALYGHVTPAVAHLGMEAAPPVASGGSMEQGV